MFWPFFHKNHFFLTCILNDRRSRNGTDALFRCSTVHPCHSMAQGKFPLWMNVAFSPFPPCFSHYLRSNSTFACVVFRIPPSSYLRTHFTHLRGVLLSPNLLQSLRIVPVHHWVNGEVDWAIVGCMASLEKVGVHFRVFPSPSLSPLPGAS